MHHIQKKIFDKFIYSDELRYMQARPIGLESNHYAYHLKELIKDGYIEKTSSGAYRLSILGMAFSERLSYQNLKVRVQPKVISLLHITNQTGETLLSRRKFQPYIGMLSLPSGKMHLDETMLAAANRELNEKIGIKGIKLSHRGLLNITIKSGGEFISQVIANVFEGHCSTANTPVSDKKADRFWADPAKCKEEFIPGFKETKKLLKGEQFFVKDFIFDLAS